MKTAGLLTTIIVHSLILCNQALAKASVALVIDYIYCDKITETSQDELYFVVNAKYSNGQEETITVEKGPNKENHWDISPEQRLELNKDNRDLYLYTAELDVNEECLVTVYLMESDNVNWGPKLQRGLDSLCKGQESADVRAACWAAHKLIEENDLENSDDCPGVFAVKLKREPDLKNDKANFLPKETVGDDRWFTFAEHCNWGDWDLMGYDEAGTKMNACRKVHLERDGSQYTLWVNIGPRPH